MRDVAEPIIGIQWANCITELSGVETDNVPKSDFILLVLIRELSHNPLHELLVHLELLHHHGHVIWRRRWIVGTTTTTTTTSHPAGFNRGWFSNHIFKNLKPRMEQRGNEQAV